MTGDILSDIAPLPPAEVEKICAGEVVERPLSVVKELIENALDAGATQVTIELEDGGKQLVRVTDNGQGISHDQLPLAVRPHCTSKIHCLEDVFALSTLGFRGEALSSIAAVSKLTLTSCQRGADLGGRIEVSGGQLLSHRRANLQRGTEVEVRELFFNTPARLKFLKSRQSESGQVSALLSAYALAYPEVRWRLSSQGRTLLSTDGDGDLHSALAGLLGPEAGGHLTQLNFEFPPSAVSGYISDPQYHRHNRQRQWYFVNRRPVSNKLLFKAVDDAVREFLSAGKFPLGAFCLELPPEEIDVNVHPMKREVSFAQPQAVYSLLTTAVRRALGTAAAARQRQLTRGLAAVVQPANRPAGPAERDAPPGFRAVPLHTEGRPIATPGRPPLPIEFPAPGPATPPAEPQVSISPAEPITESQSQQPAAAPGQACTELGLSLIAQVAGCYLVAATADELYLIDQHAAHERILFEQLYARLQLPPERQLRQQLLFPLLLELPAGAAEQAGDYLKSLRALGFQGRQAGELALEVSEVPLELAGSVSAELLAAALGEALEHGHSSTLVQQGKELAAALACRAAVKAGQRLAPDERYALVQQLLGRLSSLSCPHGRPTVVRLGAAELERLFLR